MNTSPVLLPFQKNTLLQSNDLDEAVTLINNLVEEREFMALNSRQTSEIMVTSQSVGKSKLSAAMWGRKMLARSVSLKHFCLIVPLLGKVYSRRTGRSISLGQVFLFPAGSFTDVIWELETKAIVITIDSQSIRDYFDISETLSLTDDEILLNQHNSAIADLLALVNCIIQQSYTGNDLLDNSRVQQHWEQLLIESLSSSLPSPHHFCTRKLLPFHLKKSVEFIEANIRNSITVQDLVSLTQSSRRSLENAFKANYNLSPMKYVTQQKLNAVRNILLSSEPGEVNIGEVAEQFNFCHASHFAALYQSMFDEKPSDTLKNINNK